MIEVDERLMRWLQLACLAPSAANLQPWSLEAAKLDRGYEVILKISSEYLAAPSALDPYFATATIAIGCLIKNLEVAANLEGFKTDSMIATGESPANWQWKLTLIPAKSTEIKLFCTEENLRKRVSNRSPYARQPMNYSDLEITKNVVRNYSNLKLTQVSSLRSAWTRILIRLESIRLTEDHLRNELFAELKTEKEMHFDPVGLPIETASNSRLQRFLIFLMKKLPALQWSLKFGFGSFFSWLSLRQPLFFSGEVFALQVCEEDPRSGVKLGEILEELWLLWTSLGYSAQVIALPILVFGNREGILGDTVSKASADVLEDVLKQAQQELKTDLKYMTLIVRVGRAKTSTPNSPRRKVRL
jgi:hypothetical protein